MCRDGSLFLTPLLEGLLIQAGTYYHPRWTTRPPSILQVAVVLENHRDALE